MIPGAVLAAVLLVPAPDPLHRRIDELIVAGAKNQPISEPASDGEFLRRAYLDFTGRIPPADVARAFFADPSPHKRDRVIDRLLDGPDYAPRMADAFHATLMERLGDHPEWSKWLRTAFAENRPWDVMVKQMLRSDPRDEANRGAAFFLAKRLENYGQNAVDYSALTRDVGRLFLGKNLQCAECHNHMFVADYLQSDFQGLHAFFKNAFLADAARPTVGEKPTVEKLRFSSVFGTKEERFTAPAVPGGDMLEIRTFPKGQEFEVPADPKAKRPAIPKFSTLAAAADRIATAEAPGFARNAVNRVWCLLIGRGLVHPLDLHHRANRASHEELLDLLEREFVEHKFDLKWLIREIAKSEAYLRSSTLPPDTPKAADPRRFTTALERRLSAEQLCASVLEATGERKRVLADEKAAAALSAKFLKAFANAPRDPETDVEPSLKGALFLRHDPAIRDLLARRPGNLTDRLIGLKSATAVADEMYLSVLTRPPTDAEAASVAAVLERHAGDRERAVRMLAWALLASAEFGVNH